MTKVFKWLGGSVGITVSISVVTTAVVLCAIAFLVSHSDGGAPPGEAQSFQAVTVPDGAVDQTGNNSPESNFRASVEQSSVALDAPDGEVIQRTWLSTVVTDVVGTTTASEPALNSSTDPNFALIYGPMTADNGTVISVPGLSGGHWIKVTNVFLGIISVDALTNPNGDYIVANGLVNDLDAPGGWQLTSLAAPASGFEFGLNSASKLANSAEVTRSTNELVITVSPAQLDVQAESVSTASLTNVSQNPSINARFSVNNVAVLGTSIFDAALVFLQSTAGHPIGIVDHGVAIGDGLLKQSPTALGFFPVLVAALLLIFRELPRGVAFTKEKVGSTLVNRWVMPSDRHFLGFYAVPAPSA